MAAFLCITHLVLAIVLGVCAFISCTPELHAPPSLTLALALGCGLCALTVKHISKDVSA